jgi:hypothetical protein
MGAYEAKPCMHAGRFLDHVEVTQLGGDALPIKSPVIFPCMRWVGDGAESQVTYLDRVMECCITYGSKKHGLQRTLVRKLTRSPNVPSHTHTHTSART